MKTFKIRQKQRGTGGIHDLASDKTNRYIVFRSGEKFAVVLASCYGGKGYSTHRAEAATIRASKRFSRFSHEIIDTSGNSYAVYGDELVQK